MAIHVALTHKTHYNFDKPVSLSPHIFRLRPAPHTRTPIEAYSFKLQPGGHYLNWQQDPFGNYQARVVFPEPCDHLHIEVELIARLEVINPFDFFFEESAKEYPFSYGATLGKELEPYLEKEPPSPLFRSFADQIPIEKKRTIDFLVDVNRRVNEALSYEIRLNPGVQSCEETLTRNAGSCRDFSWFMVQLFRHFGLAARFVSGYSIQLRPDEKPLEGPSGVVKDVTDLHAWVEVYVPGAGWIGLDATSGLLTTEGHIPLSCTPHYKSAAPVVGFMDPCEVSFDFSNTVQRLKEDPRVTYPYSPLQWEAIQDLGRKVDADLLSNDVRLSMGGEPTFVSIDDFESKQWNTAADGKHKRKLSWDLAEKLREEFGPGGLLHVGQGKWYPGEPLPRWSYTLYWRKDGAPLWRNPALQASPVLSSAYSPELAHTFAQSLAQKLGIPSSYIQAAYEDIFYMLWEENRLAIDEDPLSYNLDQPLERKHLAESLERGLEHPRGYIIPLDWDFARQSWRSSPWPMKRKHLFLIPGTSALGLRLPLDTLPLYAEESPEVFPERSPFETLQELPNFDTGAGSIGNPTGIVSVPVVKTAVCLEVRNGQLFVFLPPLSYMEHYAALIHAVEEVAEQLNIRVLIEGYAPPRDYRVEQIKISPDPGVIEVNIHPSSDWEGMVDKTTRLYECARLCRLGTEKFMMDGRHTGTGGGNHITVGAMQANNSPFLRRPDLLQSMVTFWQHHPSLSYLFSSAFVGPTSQAPRVDEGREDRLYEMEVAFAQVPKPEDNFPYWVVDRIFRNLLTDITGNTHRAEFCIDKLYSPDSLSGRLGLVELRGFDMPPHKYMSLLQMLLIRALISRFWQKPYQHKMVRWGTRLHDKFLLPYFCLEDMKEVVADLQEFGYPFDIQWLAPFMEFRFPRYGTTKIQDMQLEIRMAIEPWNVLGEEMSNTGTARFVDSSVERIQVKLEGFTDERYILMCNGVRVPLKETHIQGEYVAGIRYKAWAPPSALHPTIGVHAPLVFDIVDTWNGRAIGGCTYYVSHPGGLAYDTFPINAYEAESRRVNRFSDIDFSIGPVLVNPMGARRVDIIDQVESPIDRYIEVPPLNPSEEFPVTTDLRRAY